MSSSSGTYWKATRHPAPCLLFILPMLIAYEIGVVVIGGPQSLAVRNGADAWMRWLLASAGLGFGLLAPILVTLILFVWTVRSETEAPSDMPSVLLGMAIESICCALALFAMSRAFGPLMESMGLNLATRSDFTNGTANTPLAQAVTYLGAGIYEEVIFRLGLFAGLAALLRSALVNKHLASILAATVSSLAFAAVHHIGAHGETVSGYVFLFRAVAGLLFTLLFLLRGFGITVGAHAIYDVLVGITV